MDIIRGYNLMSDVIRTGLSPDLLNRAVQKNIITATGRAYFLSLVIL